MKRKDFLSSTAIGIGTLSFIPLINACKTESSKELINTSSTEVSKIFQKPKVVKEDDGIKLNVLGDQQIIKLTGADTNEQYTLIEQHNEPGSGIPPHVHENEDEVFQVLRGQVEMSIGDKMTTLEAGDIIFCPRGVPHSWKVVGNSKARTMLSIFPSGLETMFKELAALPSGPPDMEQVSLICGKYDLKFI